MSDSPSPLPRFSAYEVEGLFDRKPSWKMELASEGVTLLTGSNGTGKTTILKTIAWTAEGSWIQLFSLPFTRLRFGFSDGSTLEVERHEDGLLIARNGDEFELNVEDVVPVDLDDLSFARGRKITRVGPQRYLFQGREYSRRELSLLLGLRDLLQQRNALWVSEIPDWFRVRFVADQRLVVQPELTPSAVQRQTRSLPTRMAVEEYAEELSAEVRRNLAEFFAASQSYDQTFPERVVDAMLDPQHPLSRDEVVDLLNRVTAERLALGRVGLIEPTMGPIAFDDRHLEDEHVRQVVGTFAQDALTKFGRLQNFQRRLEQFVDFVNDHFDEKQLVVDREHGFRIQLEDETKFLRPSALSSGEQHMLVLAYRILFSARPDTVVLIDEPEISLHVVWQSKLVDDLLRMGAMSGLSFILATHSPSLVGPHEDLVRSLD